FLIGAYQYLLDWHRDWYVAEGPEKHTKELFQAAGGDWRLSTAERKRILLNNIYGVDTDPQAVEVTKLSLLLKVLEGESEQTLVKQLVMFHQRALPDLGSNIKCGNSLIGPDFYDIQQLSFLDDEVRYRINVFDWEAAFPGIMKASGFDAVIGNPPYLRIQTMKEWAPLEVEYYKRRYLSASRGNYDIYVVFVEQGLSLLNGQGRLGFILPHKFFNAQYGLSIRELVAKAKYLDEVVHFGDQQVFGGATTYTCLLFLDKKGGRHCRYTKVNDLIEWRNTGKAVKGTITGDAITGAEWNFSVGRERMILKKLDAMAVRLGHVAHIFVGTQTSADDVFVLDECHSDDNYIRGVSRSLGREAIVEAGCTRPFLRGRQIRRYEPLETNSRLVCPYHISDQACSLLTEDEMSREHPLTLAYLRANRAQLAARENGRFRNEHWYAFGYPKSMPLFRQPKIVVPDYNNVASFTLDSGGQFFKTGYGVILKDESLSQMYVLGLLNSQLLFQYLLSVGTTLRGGYVRFWTQFIKQVPIRMINPADSGDSVRHDQMVTLVSRMMTLHKQLASARTDQDKTVLERQIDATDRQIDRLVYELYGLTEDEIAIVDEGARR
ncbi:MAG: Eco57I restriction-modification methylase domain-containing protein, partial [Chloroflexi bacterium]|nr:Eco57I restriction-modification methylase domain-containing protein [Chloroflexota bacterium]